MSGKMRWHEVSFGQIIDPSRIFGTKPKEVLISGKWCSRTYLSLWEVFSKTLRQRCLVHKKKNILNKISFDTIPEVKIHLNSVYFAPDKEVALREADAFRDKYDQSLSFSSKIFQ